MVSSLKKWVWSLAFLIPGTALAEPDTLEVPFDKEEAKAAQKAWAKEWKSPVTFKNDIGIEMVIIPPGDFEMGLSDEVAEKEYNGLVAAAKPESKGDIQPDWFKRITPKHNVTITEPYYMSKHEVTKGEFAKFVKATGYKTDAEKSKEGGYGLNENGEIVKDPKYSWKDAGGFNVTDNHPVINISWNDAAAFCEWLSDEEEEEYRLPTEAEWEFAARAGTETRFYNGDDPEKLAAVGNVADASFKKIGLSPGFGKPISADDGSPLLSPVEQYEENAFGLYDMHGNVWELCDDWMAAYSGKDQEDPEGPESGVARTSRGGGWGHDAHFCTTAFRNQNDPTQYYYDTGFRVVSVYEDDDEDDDDDK